jgi:ribosome maturation factor RimP
MATPEAAQGVHMVDNLTARVREVVAGAVAPAGVDVEAVEVTRAGRRRLVRVSIDNDQGISLDDVAAVTRLVAAALDDTDVMGDQSYTLEVGSPGVSRPLTLERHWRRNIGRLVRITPLDGSSAVLGRIREVAQLDPLTIRITMADGDVLVAQDDISRAVVQVELKRPEEKSLDGH